MVCVDQFDHFVSTYRVCIRSKKLWWPFFAWAVNASMSNAWNHSRTVQKQKIGILEFQRAVTRQFWHLLGEICLKSHYRFHKMLQAVWRLILKLRSLWKAHQNFVDVNTVVVDQSIYARYAMLPNTMTVSRTIIHERQNLLNCFLP